MKCYASTGSLAKCGVRGIAIIEATKAASFIKYSGVKSEQA